MAQACSIYNSKPTLSALEIIPGSATSPNELDGLLENLRSTVCDMDAPGENTLVWVYSIAASRSIRPEHGAFFSHLD